jgi:hypothetical protein
LKEKASLLKTFKKTIKCRCIAGALIRQDAEVLFVLPVHPEAKVLKLNQITVANEF